MSSSVPAAIPAFVSIVQAALPAGFQVREGAIFGPRIDPQALLITGIHFTEDTFGEMSPAYRHEEHYEIQCALAASQGVDDQASLLTQLYGIYADISLAIANNPDLNKTVRLAWTRQLDYSMGYDGKGLTVAVLQFEVQVQVRVTSLT